MAKPCFWPDLMLLFRRVSAILPRAGAERLDNRRLTEVTSITRPRRGASQAPSSARASAGRMSGAAPAVPGSPPEALEQRTMHVFISRALHKILREAPKKHTQLRAACQEVIGVLTDP